MAADRPANISLLDAALALLDETTVLEWAELESDSTVIRVLLDSGQSVIVKSVTDVGFDQPGHDGAPQRFLNEWAGLEFLSDIGSVGVAPTLVAADAGSRLLVVEDLGERPNLESVLLEGAASAAREGLAEMGDVLGRLHGTTRGHEGTFLELQDRLGTASPRSDTTMDQRERRELFAACFESAGLAMTEVVWESIVSIEEAVHGESPFRVLVHADAGPHNLLLTGDGARLIDFEFCIFRNGLADVAGARLGFPQTTRAMAVPSANVLRLENAYRAAVSSRIPEAEDDDLFGRALVAASAHWSLNRLAAAWQLHVEPRVEAIGELPEVESARLAQTMLVVAGFVTLARESKHFEALAETVDRCVSHWRRLWPSIGGVGVYPALRNGV